MTKRERKYHQSKRWAKKQPLIFLKKRRGGFDIGVHKDRTDILDTIINFKEATKDSYDGDKIERFWHDEFCLWDTGQPIRISPKEYFNSINNKFKNKL